MSMSVANGAVRLPSADVVVLAASGPEARAFLPFMEEEAVITVTGRLWRFGALADAREEAGARQIALVHTGYGPVNAASGLTALLERLSAQQGRLPELVVQAGIGGAFVDSGLEVGDLVLATEEIYAETGVMAPEGWLSAETFAEPLVQTDGRVCANRLELDPGVAAAALEVIARDPDLPEPADGSFLTVSQVTGRAEDARELAKRWPDALVESMEGAAAAHVCLAYEVPFVEIRAVSNHLVDRDRGSWELERAAQTAARAAAAVCAHSEEIARAAPRRARAHIGRGQEPLRLAYSPCPNDTFIFHAWVQGLLAGAPPVEELLADIDELNALALRGMPDIVKVSFHAVAHLRDRYSLLHAGGALGRGCGPLLVTRAGSGIGEEVPLAGARLAVPGALTTAALLLRLYAPDAEEPAVMPFDHIMPALERGEIDAGVIIHEGRFTYDQYGLSQVADLGGWWEERTGHPLPLGGIMVHRRLPPEVAASVDHAVRRSVEHAWRDPQASTAYIRRHAQEMDPEACRRHIELYVNSFSRDYGFEGEAAIRRLLAEADEIRAVPEAGAYPLFWDETGHDTGRPGYGPPG